MGCNTIKKVVGTAQAIGNGAFMMSVNIEEFLVTSESDLEVGEAAFFGCYNLKSFASTLGNVGDAAFYANYNLLQVLKANGAEGQYVHFIPGDREDGHDNLDLHRPS